MGSNHAETTEQELKYLMITIHYKIETNRVPTEIQKHDSLIFHDQQCNFHDYLM